MSILQRIKRFMCRIEWLHRPYAATSHDGDDYPTHAKCDRCGFKGEVDSQGNLS